jgi:glutamate decarboxylase
MPDQSHKQTPYDQFNFEIPQKFPEQGVSAAAANAIVNSETWTDANPMLNLSSFVTTYCEPEAKDLYDLHMFRNFADPDMYPHTTETEFQCVQWLHDLWNGPKDAEPYGVATIGSSEACMLGGLAHKWNWREARKKAGKDSSRPNMVTGGNVQIVWKKFLRYFDVEPRIVPLKPGNYRLTAEHLDKYVDENTICVVAIAGQTFTGEDDDIQEIHDWLDDYEVDARSISGFALARVVFFNRLGEIRDRSFENQRYRASGLNLVVAAIALWKELIDRCNLVAVPLF